MNDFYMSDAFRLYRKKVIEVIVNHTSPLLYSHTEGSELAGSLGLAKRIISIPLNNVTEEITEDIKIDLIKDMEDLKISLIQKQIMED
jgi:hypothetical protein